MSQTPKTEENTEAAPHSTRVRSRFLNPANLIFGLAAIVALIFLILYSRQNASLISQNDDLRDRVDAYSTYLTAQVGDAVPPIETVDIKGNPIRVDYRGEKKHLLFVFTTHCPACLDELPRWNGLSENEVSRTAVVLGVSVDSLDDTKTNLAGKYERLNTIIAPDRTFLRTYRVNNFPQVMIISNQGVVEWVHVGKLSEADFAEMLKKLQV